MLIIGDFNAIPSSFNGTAELMEEEAWIDVGAVASWWGGIDNQPTCAQRAGARETRIDGVMANCMAIPYIRGFEVEKDPMIPTHSVVKLYLDLEAVEEPRSFIKTLPSSKSMLDTKIAKAIESIEDKKEQAEKARQMRQDLHALMDKQLQYRAHRFQHYRECKDTDSYWNTWSIAVEKAWLQYLEVNKEFEKAAKGRGQCTFIRTRPKPKGKLKEEELDTVRNKEAYLAIAQLKQSRRCGQFAE